MEQAPGSDAPPRDEQTPETTEQRTEHLTGRMDEAFEDLIDLAAQSPEAQRAAVQALVAHIHQTAEQLAQVRDAKHMQELKRLMLKNWQELQELTKGDPALLKGIQAWGKKFIDQKIIFMEAIEEVKDDMADKAHDIQIAWNEVQGDLGRAAGLIGPSAKAKLSSFWKSSHGDINFGEMQQGQFSSGPGLDKFLASMTNLETGFSSADVDGRRAAKFLELANELVSELYALAAEESRSFGAEGKEHAASAIKLLDEAVKKMGGVSKEIREASKIFKVIKRLNETAFLPLYNEIPESLGAAA
ncbi:MAG: hypothetical protein ND866_18980 [Pyrinomonadaceae bacterium]|nr:hypothetical protein [Pyrinomonadaceae bacterium]